jgi:hypothetical protein
VNESVGRLGVALADEERRYELGVRVDRDEGPGVTYARGVVFDRDMALLLADERPELIDLQAIAAEVAHGAVQQISASVADSDQNLAAAGW